MALLGDTINPNLGIQDYSAFGNASRVSGQSILDLVSGITQTNDDFRDEQKKIKETTKAGADAIKAAGILFPEMKPKLDLLGSQLDDPGKTPREKAAFASEIKGLIDMGVRTQQQDRNFGLQERQLANSERATAADIRGADASLARNERADAAAIKAQALDASTQAAVGPILLDQVKGLLGENYSGVKANSPEEAYSIATTLSKLVPEQQKKSFQLQDIELGDGRKIKMAFDPATGSLAPIPGVGSAVGGGQVAPEALPEGLRPHAAAFNAAGAKYGVDPRALAAISIHETGGGTSSAFKNKNNAMGISDNSGPIEAGSVEASIDKMARLLAAGAKGEGPYAGKTTIGQIAGTYAPVGASNDPRGLNGSWASGVGANMAKLGADPSAQITVGQIGVSPAPNQQPTISEGIALKNQAEKEAADAAKAEISDAGKLRSLKTIDKFLTKDGKPTAALSDAVGFGEGVGSWIGNIPFIPGGNSPTAMSDQREIAQDLLEGSVLEAAQYLKPLSNSDIQLILKNRPEITSHPTVWATYLTKIREKLSNPANYKDGVIPSALTPNADPAAAATARIRGLLAPK